MDLVQVEPGSSNESCVTSTHDGNGLIGIEDEMMSDVSAVVHQVKTKIPPTKKDPNIASTLVAWSEPSVIASELRSINDLPHEILLQILSHLGPEDIRLNIANVCEKWKILVEDKLFWKTLSYKCDHSSDISRVKEVLTNAPALHSLIVWSRMDAALLLEFLFNFCGYLRKLVIHDCCLGEDSTGLLAKIVYLYPDLEFLSLQRSYPLSSSGYHLIPRLKKLSELNLSHCKELCGESIRLIADSCQHLQKLRLNGLTQIDDNDVIHVINKLGKQLTTLTLDGYGLTDVAYLYLNNCARLQELGVSFCHKMTHRGLLDGIGSLRELTSLHLNWGQTLTAQTLSTFLHRPSFTSIVSLFLSSYFNLDDEGLKGIAERCLHLKELVVAFCDSVTDAGIRMVVKDCNQLRILKLRYLPSITGNGWLALVPSSLPHLRQLCLASCYNVVDKYVEELMAAVPELEVTKLPINW